MRRFLAVLLPVALALSLSAFLLRSTALAQDDSTFEIDPKSLPNMTDVVGPAYCLADHNIGRIVLGTTNFGRLGRGDEVPYVDFFTGGKYYNCQYPKGSLTNYLWKGGVWIGAVVGRDTLVSSATDVYNRYREINPDPAPAGYMTRRSIAHPEWPDFSNAVSEQDFISQATDTNVSGNPYPSFDVVSSRAHRPLPIQLDQKSYAWSYDYADDFVLFDWRVRNIGQKPLKDVYIGLYMDIDVGLDRLNPYAQQSPPPPKPITEGKDDITGFLYDFPASYEKCNFKDTIRLAWAADNDGKPLPDGSFQVPNAVGVRFLGDLSSNPGLAYNWWVFNYNPVLDFGPQSKAHYRPMNGGLGTPAGDRNKYAVMSNGEIDYDQVFAAGLSPTDPTWVYPNINLMRGFVRGADNQFCLSVGPFQLGPGQSMLVPWAFVGGENFHTVYNNQVMNIRFQYNPMAYYANLNFADFAKNAVWASWVYDNPGVDTDGNDYAGKKRICVLDSSLIDGRWVATQAETTYYEGDGVADYRGAAPPDAPYMWVYPESNALRVRFNGQKSETSRDVFSKIVDFEGYRVYISRDDRESSYSLLASYDRENFDKWVYNFKMKPRPGFELRGLPMTLADLRCAYGKAPNPCADTTFDPLAFTAAVPYMDPRFPDSAFYFTKHDYNASNFGVNTPIKKIYPDAPQPSQPPIPADYTDDGYLKYYEYEMTIDNLLPTVPYWVNVTAFDFGAPGSSLAPLRPPSPMEPNPHFPTVRTMPRMARGRYISTRTRTA